MKQIIINEKCFLINGNKIIGQILKNGKICVIKFINYISSDGKLNKYYIRREGYLIGWINGDLTECKGKDLINQDILSDIMHAMNILKNASRELCC
ncbi:MAG: hypothetical protein GYA50_03470 [Eubacteriaceae bacterium]|nr:hypothetical protein [Eubacteriaceae bacterium]